MFDGIQYTAIHDNCACCTFRGEPQEADLQTDAHQRRDEGLIGRLSPDGVETMQEDAIRAAKELEQVKAQRQQYVLQPDVFVPAKLLRRRELNSDSRYAFRLDV